MLNCRTLSHPSVAATIALAAGLQFGCVSDASDAPEARGEPGTRLAGRPVAVAWRLATDSFANPTALGLVGSRLVVVDQSGTHPIHSVDAASGHLLGSFSRPGEGPCEFIGASSVVGADASGAIGIYDLSLRRVSWLLPEWLEGGGPAFAECLRRSVVVRLEATGTVIAPNRLDDSTLVAGGFYSEGRLAFFRFDGTRKGFAGAVPPAPHNPPPHVAQHAHQASVAVRPNGASIAVASRHANRLEIYDHMGRSLGVFGGPFAVEPVFEIARGSRGPVFSSGDSTRFGYVGVAASDQWIFALFSGRARYEAPGRASLGQSVHIFDWAGRFIESLSLSGEAVAIAVSPDGATLYAAEREPAVALRAYRTSLTVSK